MNYNFDSTVATFYGVDEAIMINNLYFWISKNKANGKHFYDGKYWTYNSARAFSKLFPFWSKRQIERILKSLEKQGCVVVGNYNDSPYDRTKWYAITDTILRIYSNECSQITKCVNENTKTVTPIPDNKTDNKTDNKYIYSSITEFLNQKAGTNYRSTGKKTKELINARLNEGFTEEDFFKVIENKVTEWKDTTMEKFLRPETLFGTKFEGYLNQREGKNGGGINGGFTSNSGPTKNTYTAEDIRTREYTGPNYTEEDYERLGIL